jgi:hypothetical protein
MARPRLGPCCGRAEKARTARRNRGTTPPIWLCLVAPYGGLSISIASPCCEPHRTSTVPPGETTWHSLCACGPEGASGGFVPAVNNLRAASSPFIKTGAAKLKADRTARLEAEFVVDHDHWNRGPATRSDMPGSPAIRAARLRLMKMRGRMRETCATSRPKYVAMPRRRVARS